AQLTQLGGNGEVTRLVAPPPAPGGGGAPASGEAVRDAQIKLSRVQASALPLTEDGRYGPLTEAAVRTFQTTAGIVPPTRVLDAGPRPRLDAAFAALPPPARTPVAFGATGADVAFAQQKLNALGAAPRLVVNASFDGAMLVAVLKY